MPWSRQDNELMIPAKARTDEDDDTQCLLLLKLGGSNVPVTVYLIQ